MIVPHSPARVVIVNDDSIASGGATGLALLEMELLRQRNIPVTYVTGDAGANPLFARLGVEVVPLGQERLLRAGLHAATRGIYNRATLSLIGDWIRMRDTPGTVYHLHGWSQILSPSVFAALGPVRERLMITAHDFFLVCPNGAYADYQSGSSCALVPLGTACLGRNCDKRSYAHKLWRSVRQAAQSRALAFAEGRPSVLMIHPGMRGPLERGGIPAGCLTTVPNPIAPWSTTRIEAERNAEFVFVGRLAEEKGPDLAARAARRANVPLTIIGDGPMLAALRRDFPEVTFCGRLPPADVAKRVRSARALVMPSRYPEPYGLVAGEALWSGIPVIAPEFALLAPGIVRSGAGLACTPNSEEAFAAAMGRLAADDQLVSDMSHNAVSLTRDIGLSTDAWAERLIDIFTRHLVEFAEAATTAA